jgi:nudix-type nucleoside diphosphatase (YffH/AdpP family)
MGGATLAVGDVPGWFFCGPLADRALLATVLGRAVALEQAGLADHRSTWPPGARCASLMHTPGAQVSGWLARDLCAEDVARLDYYLHGTGWTAHDVDLAADCDLAATAGRARAPVRADDSAVAADADALASRPDAPRWVAILRLAAREYMDGFGQMEASDAASRFGVMLMRASATARAAARDVPATVRSGLTRDSVQTHAARRPYSLYFTIQEHDLRFPRFDGSMSETVTRATFVDGDAITVLPYDPVRDRVMLVEQFRFGPYVRGERLPWMLEAVAGRIDPGESPAAAAARELAEETGVTAERLIEIASYYPSSGAVTGYYFSYVALCDLPDRAAGVAGLECEAEDIRSHVMGFDAAMRLVQTGEAEAGPLILSMFWLENRRATLRNGA